MMMIMAKNVRFKQLHIAIKKLYGIAFIVWQAHRVISVELKRLLQHISNHVNFLFTCLPHLTSNSHRFQNLPAVETTKTIPTKKAPQKKLFECQKQPLQVFYSTQACNFIKKWTLAQVFSFEFFKIFKNTFFAEHTLLVLIIPALS